MFIHSRFCHSFHILSFTTCSFIFSHLFECGATSYGHVSIFRYLLSEQSRLRSVNDIMPMIGARFYTQLDASQMRNDVIEEDLAKVLKLVSSL